MVKYKVIILRCECGHELETDLDAALVSTTPCVRCGKTSWKQLQGKTVHRDKSAPTELIEAQEKERNRKGEDD